ncbi:integrase family protein [Accumulibacter sp.]|uniref:tyrosine-type recombinase/integrase n=1 Tax=Accumulibacter sp. TaxID=2053492 RepID=UPI0025EE6F27|nr:integrase family protein [Accumulibacter sp.]MCM8612457.1 integrase family protein [Accumulibacter sp.]MCM8636854.1 integrase family protein [Accumulibacter sp.]MCM8641179.1 integrase family protein [Accumulibacter sp.]
MNDSTRRERLTLPRITAFTCPAGQHQAFLWDSDVPRLAVRATAGSKAFFFQSKMDGQVVRITIGSVVAWTIAAARAEACRLQTMIDQGADPRAEKRERIAAAARKIAEEEAQAAALVAEAEAAQREQEKRQRYTLRALCEAYCALLDSRGKPSARQARSILKVHVFDAHPDIAALPARELTALQVASMVRKTREAGHERTAGVLRAYLSAAFTAGRKAPFDASLPAALIPFEVEANPVEAIPAIAVRAGNRTLSVDEMRTYLAKLGDDIADRALLLALLAGGQRMAQLLRAKVSDYNPDEETLRLWDAKGRRAIPREHVLPLAPRAAALVAGLAERAKARESTLLFSTHGLRQMAETTPGKRAAAISAAMGGEPFDLRDVRRTVETMLASMGLSRDTRAQLLSHGISGVQAAHYDRHAYTDEKRAALVAWEARLDEIETGRRTPNVVAMKAQRTS